MWQSVAARGRTDLEIARGSLRAAVEALLAQQPLEARVLGLAHLGGELGLRAPHERDRPPPALPSVFALPVTAATRSPSSPPRRRRAWRSARAMRAPRSANCALARGGGRARPSPRSRAWPSGPPTRAGSGRGSIRAAAMPRPGRERSPRRSAQPPASPAAGAARAGPCAGRPEAAPRPGAPSQCQTRTQARECEAQARDHPERVPVGESAIERVVTGGIQAAPPRAAPSSVDRVDRRVGQALQQRFERALEVAPSRDSSVSITR